MNSDLERQRFEDHGWTHDLIGRRWVSPLAPEVFVTTDQLVEEASPTFDRWLTRAICAWGNCPVAHGGMKE